MNKNKTFFDYLIIQLIPNISKYSTYTLIKLNESSVKITLDRTKSFILDIKDIEDEKLCYFETLIDSINQNKKLTIDVSIITKLNKRLDGLLAPRGYKNMSLKETYSKDYDKYNHIIFCYKKSKDNGLYFHVDLTRRELVFEDDCMNVPEKGLGFKIMNSILKSLQGKKYKVILPKSPMTLKLADQHKNANIIIEN